MKRMNSRLIKGLWQGLICFTLGSSALWADNQTSDVSPLLLETSLPFRIVIEKVNFELPVGLHSGMVGVYKGQWVFIAGVTDGLHGFGPDPFPVSAQNTKIYVVNPETGSVNSRSLSEPGSGLSQRQIDTLSVVSPQGYQEGNTLYMTGGYGIDTASGTFGTKPVLTAIYLPGIVQWVMQPNDASNTVSKNIQQIYHSAFQVTGGEMLKLGNVSQLVFGQNFDGVYLPGSNGNYTNQVRQFQINSINGHLVATHLPSKPQIPDPSYRRRDLNVLPAFLTRNNHLQYGMVAYGGVFTLSGGVWTVPVIMDESGTPTMANPDLPTTFKQGMNQYVCATASLYSRKYKNMYHIFFGGLSYGYFSGGTFLTDSEVPFINQVTTISMDQKGNFSQYIMNNEYPVILSTTVNPGNPLLFGAGAYFIRKQDVAEYSNQVLSLDHLRTPTVIGYIVGGIASTLPNTNTQSDSFASRYVFKVTLVPKG
jgi:hypothetical protein